MLPKLRHAQVATNCIRLHVVQAGPEDGSLVILLHGFPEFWYGWRRQIPALAEAGFRVWVPDQRGYNLSDMPPKVSDYRIELLAKDILGLIDAAGRERAIVIGHDWGAAVAWRLAEHHPERVDRAAMLNVPHPAVMMRHLRRSPKQMLRSWYIAFFQLPWLPERLAEFRHGKLLENALRSTSRPGTFSGEELVHYRQAWSQPGALRGMLNWYRAAARHPASTKAARKITPPILLIWGAQDTALGREMARPSIELCEQGRLEFIEEATHWVQHEEPRRVNELLLKFVRPSAIPQGEEVSRANL